MTREELLKMSKKDLKNRLAELGKNAQTLSGQELTDAMDEARTIGEILDEIKGREELEAAARAAGAADPDEGPQRPAPTACRSAPPARPRFQPRGRPSGSA